ncbi:hypothetical protein HanRHA438_Chr06g0283251 [Helianthus annuus]|nr:hypothetical protein HanRHA438_Chr06g0283251 [Helianthus annuus]
MIQQQATTNQWWRMAALTQRRDRERGNDGGSAVCGGTTGNKQSCDGGYGSDGCFIFSNMSPGNPSHLSLSLSLSVTERPTATTWWQQWQRQVFQMQRVSDSGFASRRVKFESVLRYFRATCSDTSLGLVWSKMSQFSLDGFTAVWGLQETRVTSGLGLSKAVNSG